MTIPTQRRVSDATASVPRQGIASGPILLVRLGAVGDVIRALPALELLRRTFPDAPVDWLVEERCAGVLQGHPDLRQMVILRRRQMARLASKLRLIAAWRTLQEALGPLLHGRYGAVIDLQGTLKSALLARATGAPVRVGMAAGHAKEGAHRFYTERVELGNERLSRVERNLRLLAPLGVDPSAGPRPEARLPLSDVQRAWGRGVIESMTPGNAPRVLLYPGTSERQSYKRWPAERFGFLAGRLQDEGYQVLVAGGPDEASLVQEVCAATSSPPAVIPPSDLGQLGAVIESVDLFVGGDTGPLHLAWAVGTRVLGLFGATDPVVNAPYDAHGIGHRVLYGGPRTRPYRIKGERARSWMEALSVDAVAEACLEMLRA